MTFLWKKFALLIFFLRNACSELQIFTCGRIGLDTMHCNMTTAFEQNCRDSRLDNVGYLNCGSTEMSSLSRKLYCIAGHFTLNSYCCREGKCPQNNATNHPGDILTIGTSSKSVRKSPPATLSSVIKSTRASSGGNKITVKGYSYSTGGGKGIAITVKGGTHNTVGGNGVTDAVMGGSDGRAGGNATANAIMIGSNGVAGVGGTAIPQGNKATGAHTVGNTANMGDTPTSAAPIFALGGGSSRLVIWAGLLGMAFSLWNN